MGSIRLPILHCLFLFGACECISFFIPVILHLKLHPVVATPGGLAFLYTRTPKQFASVSLFGLHVLCQRQVEQSDTVGCAKVRHPASCALSKREGAVEGGGLPSGEHARRRRRSLYVWAKNIRNQRSATRCVDPARSHRMTTRSGKVMTI